MSAFTLVLLNPDLSLFENIVDPDPDRHLIRIYTVFNPDWKYMLTTEISQDN